MFLTYKQINEMKNIEYKTELIFKVDNEFKTEKVVAKTLSDGINEILKIHPTATNFKVVKQEEVNLWK